MLLWSETVDITESQVKARLDVKSGSSFKKHLLKVKECIFKASWAEFCNKPHPLMQIEGGDSAVILSHSKLFPEWIDYILKLDSPSSHIEFLKDLCEIRMVEYQYQHDERVFVELRSALGSLNSIMRLRDQMLAEWKTLTSACLNLDERTTSVVLDRLINLARLNPGLDISRLVLSLDRFISGGLRGDELIAEFEESGDKLYLNPVPVIRAIWLRRESIEYAKVASLKVFMFYRTSVESEMNFCQVLLGRTEQVQTNHQTRFLTDVYAGLVTSSFSHGEYDMLHDLRGDSEEVQLIVRIRELLYLAGRGQMELLKHRLEALRKFLQRHVTTLRSSWVEAAKLLLRINVQGHVICEDLFRSMVTILDEALTSAPPSLVRWGSVENWSLVRPYRNAAFSSKSGFSK